MKQANLYVGINNEDAKARLKEIEGQLQELIRLRDKAFQDKDVTAYTKLDKQINKLTGESKKLERGIFEVDKVLKNLSGASVIELEKALKKVNSEIRSMKRNDPGLGEKKNQAALLSSELDKAVGRSREHTGGIKKLADGFNRYFGIATAAVATFTGVVFGLRKAVDTFNVFEKRVDNLSALTGLVGDDLDWLTEKAKEMSTATLEGNVRIASSATEIVDAYTKVGSKRPELLKVKEDLNGVTQEAMILAAAANGDLQPAVDGLTMVLNQFNAPASESRKIINILAAGSKEGAGEIDYLAAGFEKAGSVAASFGISIEELTGALETLAPRMTEPEMAGRSLRNIMLKLETQSDENLRPSIVGLQQAFVNMKAAQWDVIKLTDLFGTENINAANILFNNTAEFKKYTTAVTGTSVALEQASINTDNNATKLQQAKNRAELVTIAFGEKLAPAITFSTNAFTYFMRAIMYAPEFFVKYQIALIAVAGATLALKSALIAESIAHVYNNLLLKEGIGLRIKNAIADSTLAARKQLLIIWTMGETTATKLAASAQLAWNLALSANPLGAVITLVTALVFAIKLYDKYSAESLRLEKEKLDAIEKLNIANQNLKINYQNQEIAISQLNKMSAEQKRTLLEQTKATLNQAEAELVLMQATQKRIEQDNTRVTLWQRMVNTVLLVNNPALANIWNAFDAVKNGAAAADEMTDSIKQMQDQIKQLWGQYSGLDETVNAESIADQITGKAVTQLEEKQRLLTTALKNYEKGSEEYKRIADKLKAVSNNLNEALANDLSGPIDQFAALTDRIKKTEDAIRKLILANQPVPESMIRQLVKDRAELARVEQSIKNIAVEIGRMSGIPTPKKLEDKPWFNVRPQESKLKNNNEDPQAKWDAEQAKQEAWKNAALDIANSTQNAIFDIIKNRQQAELDAKLASLNAQREAELANTNLTEEQRAKINEKYRKREAQMKLEAWKKEKAANIVSAIMKTAMAVLTQLSGGDPVTAIPRAIAAGIMGAAETAVIIAQKPPQFYAGGFTDEDPDDYKAVGVVHANEFVANAAANRNPTIRPILNLIDYAQRAGTARHINLPAVIESTTPRLAPGQPQPTKVNQTGRDADPEMIDAMNRFSDAAEKLMREGVSGKWVYQDFKIMADKETKAIAKTG